MTYQLLTSFDSGLTYRETGQSSSIHDLMRKAPNSTVINSRWVIVKGQSLISVCPYYVDAMPKFRRYRVVYTQDKFLTQFLQTYGIATSEQKKDSYFDELNYQQGKSLNEYKHDRPLNTRFGRAT